MKKELLLASIFYVFSSNAMEFNVPTLSFGVKGQNEPESPDEEYIVIEKSSHGSTPRASVSPQDECVTPRNQSCAGVPSCRATSLSRQEDHKNHLEDEHGHRDLRPSMIFLVTAVSGLKKPFPSLGSVQELAGADWQDVERKVYHGTSTPGKDCGTSTPGKDHGTSSPKMPHRDRNNSQSLSPFVFVETENGEDVFIRTASGEEAPVPVTPLSTGILRPESFRRSSCSVSSFR